MALDNYRILVENEVSPWDDKTGERYHFPKNRYLNRLRPGMRFIYYKGRVGKEPPQYFGYGEILKIYPDPESIGYYYADINNYIPFNEQVNFKFNGKYLEDITPSNPFRQNSVRPISQERFVRILELAEINIEKTDREDQPILVSELPPVSEVTTSLTGDSLLKSSAPKIKGRLSEPSSNYYNTKKSTLHGNQGEYLVMKHLRATLTELEGKSLRHHAIENEKDGYDISYTNLYGQKVYIEVKATSASSFPNFVLTVNELSAAEKYGAAYQIYLVNKVTTKDVNIEVIENLADLIKLGEFVKSAIAFKVEKK